MIVRIREACPGQSTSVYCSAWYGVPSLDASRCAGMGRRNALKRRGRNVNRSDTQAAAGAMA